MDDSSEFPIIFRLITFNDLESHYSQPKLELYGVFRVLKAECHQLHGIHFRLMVDASSLVKMLHNPELPNVAIMRWIAYILLFTFTIQHNPTEKHRVPDGLSRHMKAEDDSDYSNSDKDERLENIKLVKVPGVEAEGFRGGYGYKEVEILPPRDSKLDRRLGEVCVLEMEWREPASLRFEKGLCYAGEGVKEIVKEMDHQHQVPGRDNEEFWDSILAYLRWKQVPSNEGLAKKVRCRREFAL